MSRNCPKCNSVCKDTDKFCLQCGYQFADEIVCPSCNTVNYGSNTHCIRCGENLTGFSNDKWEKIEISPYDLSGSYSGGKDYSGGNDYYSGSNDYSGGSYSGGNDYGNNNEVPKKNSNAGIVVLFIILAVVIIGGLAVIDYLPFSVSANVPDKIRMHAKEEYYISVNGSFLSDCDIRVTSDQWDTVNYSSRNFTVSPKKAGDIEIRVYATRKLFGIFRGYTASRSYTVKAVDENVYHVEMLDVPYMWDVSDNKSATVKFVIKNDFDEKFPGEIYARPINSNSGKMVIYKESKWENDNYYITLTPVISDISTHNVEIGAEFSGYDSKYTLTETSKSETISIYDNSNYALRVKFDKTSVDVSDGEQIIKIYIENQSGKTTQFGVGALSIECADIINVKWGEWENGVVEMKIKPIKSGRVQLWVYVDEDDTDEHHFIIKDQDVDFYVTDSYNDYSYYDY